MFRVSLVHRILPGILILLAAGPWACTSAEETCKEARKPAAEAWGKYVAVLEADRVAHKKTMVDGKLQMEGDIDKRLAAKAKAEASRRHDQGTTEWHRAYAALYKAGCTGDPECTKVRLALSEAEERYGALEKEIGLAQAAQRAAAQEGGAAALDAAAKEVVEDFEHAEYKAAMGATAPAVEACAEL